MNGTSDAVATVGAPIPGAIVVDGGGTVRWVYRGRHPGALSTMAAMLETVRGLHP